MLLGLAVVIHVEQQAKFIYQEPSKMKNSGHKEDHERQAYYPSFRQPERFYWLICISSVMVIAVLTLFGIVLQKLFMLRSASDSKQSEMTNNEKELRSMCNSVLLSRVVQCYHPYYSMSAILTPESQTCKDKLAFDQEIKKLKQQQTVQQLHCFKNAYCYDVNDFNVEERRRNTRHDSRFPKITTVTGLDDGILRVPLHR